jgi:alpha-glucoside transport system permease protein
LDHPGSPAEAQTPPQILLGEVAVVDDTGPPRGARYRPLSWTRPVWLAPTVLLLLLAVVWPVVWTLQGVLLAEPGSAGDLLWRTVSEPTSQRAILLTLTWTVAVPLVVVVLGYLLAVSLRRARLGGVATAVLVAPMALPMVVTGVAFRLFYHPDPGRGGASFLVSLLGVDPPLWLGPDLITVSLMSAFVWAWVGLAVIVFRAALDGFPHELLDAARIEGATGWELFRAVRLPVLRPIAVLLFALVGVATARSFDLLLVTAPDSVRDDAAVLPWYIWQRSGEPQAAALSLVWLLILAVWVSLASWGSRQQWRPVAIRIPERRDRVPWWRPGRVIARARRLRIAMTARWLGRLAVSLAVLVWAAPLVLLVLTAVRPAVDGKVAGWDAKVAGSFAALFADTQMGEALVRTALLATVVTAIVVTVSVLAGYALVWLGTPGRGSAAVVMLLAAAVIPVQVVVMPVSEVLNSAGISPVLTLILIHVAVGIPFTVLVFRWSFARVPADQVRRARLLRGGEWTVLRRVVLPMARPSLVALAALEFIQVWNDLVVSLLVGAPEVLPIGPVLLSQVRQFTSGAGVLAAGSVVASLVPLGIVVLARRHIVAALVSGVVRR